MPHLHEDEDEDDDDDDSEEEEEDSSETDSEDDSEEQGAALEGDFNLADYDYLPVSSEIKELFEYIKRYTPKTIEIEHKLQPFIPDFIPAVGDIDAFLKVPRPDGKPDNLGLLVLDEPSTKQSDPTVLSLWLTESSKQHNIAQQIKVKSLENAEKNPKAIESWIESISELHRCKPPATVHYSRPMPDIETLMQEWSPEFEELLGKVGLPTAEMDCDLAEYIDMICAVLDIPVYKSRIQPLHVLFSLYSEFKNSQHFKPLADGKKGQSPSGTSPSSWASSSSSSSSPGISPKGVLGLKMVCRTALSLAVAMVPCAPRAPRPGCRAQAGGPRPVNVHTAGTASPVHILSQPGAGPHRPQAATQLEKPRLPKVTRAHRPQRAQHLPTEPPPQWRQLGAASPPGVCRRRSGDPGKAGLNPREEIQSNPLQQ
ncbi:PREDICTED: intraflagellar transport protein 46 homolog [Charadrius vociferus]|uniref:intraflagellar transport protein 46 homolog n=1 Tax=Charadrius vociferus TaxID=50402 RepID=UPI0005217514|nr:PREDICTED: intraflagellar transport protein 46 homolog [Charadrius vociferus]